MDRISESKFNVGVNNVPNVSKARRVKLRCETESRAYSNIKDEFKSTSSKEGEGLGRITLRNLTENRELQSKQSIPESESPNRFFKELVSKFKEWHFSNPIKLRKLIDVTFTHEDLEFLLRKVKERDLENIGWTVDRLREVVSKRERLLSELKQKVVRRRETLFLSTSRTRPELGYDVKCSSTPFYKFGNNIGKETFRLDYSYDIIKNAKLSVGSNASCEDKLFKMNISSFIPGEALTGIEFYDYELTVDGFNKLLALTGADVVKYNDKVKLLNSSLEFQLPSEDELKYAWDKFNLEFRRNLFQTVILPELHPQDAEKRFATLMAIYWQNAQLLVNTLLKLIPEDDKPKRSSEVKDEIEIGKEPAKGLAFDKFLEERGFKLDKTAYSYRQVLHFLAGELTLSDTGKELLTDCLRTLQELSPTEDKIFVSGTLTGGKPKGILELRENVSKLFKLLKEYRERLPQISGINNTFFRWAPERTFVLFEFLPSKLGAYMVGTNVDGWTAMGDGLYIAGNITGSINYGYRVNVVKLKRGARVADITDKLLVDDCVKFLKASGLSLPFSVVKDKVLPLLADVTRYNDQHDWYVVKNYSVIEEISYDEKILREAFYKAFKEKGLLEEGISNFKLKSNAELIYKAHINLLERPSKLDLLEEGWQFLGQIVESELKSEIMKKLGKSDSEENSLKYLTKFRNYRELTDEELRTMLEDLKRYFREWSLR